MPQRRDIARGTACVAIASLLLLACEAETAREPLAASAGAAPAESGREKRGAGDVPVQPLTPEIALPTPAIPTPNLDPPGTSSDRALLLGARAIAIRAEALPAPFELLRAFAEPKRAPEASDWLANEDERGQSFGEFRAAFPPLPGRTIYLTTADTLSPAHRAVARELEPLLRAFFQVAVQWQPALPDEAVRVRRREWELGPQLYTHAVMDALAERKPKDAVAFMAIAQVDLYPNPDWNFVYGQAHYGKRVGVMSLARDGDVETERERLLRRALSTASHEIGHLFGIRHCIAWECGMNGRNHRAEADATPLEYCPACLAKLQLAIGFEPESRWRELTKQLARVGLGADALAVTQMLRVVEREEQRAP